MGDDIIEDAKNRVSTESASFEATIEKLEKTRVLMERDRTEAAIKLREAQENAKKAAFLRAELEVRLEKADTKSRREAERIGRVVDILLEIHVAQEESKSGWDYDELVAYLQSEEAATLHNIRIRGVMGMATNTDNETVVRADFNRLASHYTEMKQHFGGEFNTLSMGMSDDYMIAIECGSTMVRIGSSIFGNRY